MAWLAAVTTAAGPAVRLWLAPGRLSVAPGDTFEVRVQAEAGQPVSHLPLSLSFDPAVLAVERVDAGEFLGGSAEARVMSDSGRPGALVIGASRLGKVPGVKGKGTVARITFRAVAAGSSELAFEGKALDAALKPLAVRTRPALIEVGAGEPTPRQPTATSQQQPGSFRHRQALKVTGGLKRRCSAEAPSTLRRRSQAGFTLAELVTVAAVMAILATVTLPVAKFTAKRSREADLRQALREMRSAVDEYKRYSEAGLIPVDLGTDGYPKKLEVLVEGVDIVGQVDKKLKLLRRIPIDPMTGKDEWGLRSYQDDLTRPPGAARTSTTCTPSRRASGLNGVPYRKW